MGKRNFDNSVTTESSVDSESRESDDDLQSDSKNELFDSMVKRDELIEEETGGFQLKMDKNKLDQKYATMNQTNQKSNISNSHIDS